MNILQTAVHNTHSTKPPRIVVYGKPGIGKTTFAAGANKPLIIDLEGSADYIDVPKANPKNFAEFTQIIDALLAEQHDYKTLCIDTLDWLESMIHEDICKRVKAKTITDKHVAETAYGNGHILATNSFIDIRNKLDRLRIEKGMAIVLNAHTLVKKRNDPLDGDFDEHALKLHDKFAGAAVEWADAVLLLKQKTIQSDKTPNGLKEVGRVMYTSGILGTTTKNRLYLPETIPATWNDFINAINTNKGE
jgi:AAA domain